MTQIMFREMEEDDKNFVFSSWLRSYRDSNCGKEQTTDSFFRIHSKVLTKHIPKFNVIIACDDSNKKSIMGFCCFSRTVANICLVHYVYIKKTYRQVGVAQSLITLGVGDSSDVIITHLTPQGNQLMKKMKLNYYYSPALFYLPNLFEE